LAIDFENLSIWTPPGGKFMIMRRFGATVLVLIPLVTLAGSSSSGAPDRDRVAAQPTVGEFAAGLARATDRTGSPAADSADRLLERIGIAGSARAPLTEGAAVALLRDVGIAARTLTPGRLVSEGRAATLLRQVEDRLAAGAGAVGLSAVQASPATLDDCFALRSHGECVTCCKDEGFSGSVCAKACFVINKPSESEPLP
jgi:hypothetical protein